MIVCCGVLLVFGVFGSVGFSGEDSWVRIELGEIESALGALPGVSGAVVVVHGGSRLVGM